MINVNEIKNQDKFIKSITVCFYDDVTDRWLGTSVIVDLLTLDLIKIKREIEEYAVDKLYRIIKHNRMTTYDEETDLCFHTIYGDVTEHEILKNLVVDDHDLSEEFYEFLCEEKKDLLYDEIKELVEEEYGNFKNLHKTAFREYRI